MFLAQVVGTVVSPVQHPVLERQRLLMLVPVDPEGRRAGPLRIGIDRASASEGDRVLVVDEGNSARQALAAKDAPVKTVVVGIVDYVEVGNDLRYDYRRADADGAPRS